jgi:enoyl-[acyl-carrier-protein] reductase (NADH)
VGKAALLALTRQWALELAPHVRANAVAPSTVLPAPWFDPAQSDRLARRNLLNRWGRPEDVAQAVLYLVGADFVTGETITVDGGERLGHLRYRFSEEDGAGQGASTAEGNSDRARRNEGWVSLPHLF